MNKSYYWLSILFLTSIFYSCEKEVAASLSPLKIGSGEATLDAVSIQVLSERDILLQGGNGKYKANIEDSRIATAKVVGDTLRVKGLTVGETFIRVVSHNQQQRVELKVETAVPHFSQKVIRVYPDRKVVRKFVSLTGGDEFTSLEVVDPDDILEVKWNGKSDLLEIKAFYEGDALIKASTPNGQVTELKVEVRVEDEPQKVGVYHTSGRYVNNNVALNGVLVVQRENRGVWISNTASPYVGNVVYTGSCIQFDPIKDPVEGKYIELSVQSFAGPAAIPAGKYRVLVEKIKGNLVQLRSNRYKFLLPYEGGKP